MNVKKRTRLVRTP